MTALQFEAEWERIHAELQEVGLGKSKLEKFLAYITKVGSPANETIRMDRRPRPDGGVRPAAAATRGGGEYECCERRGTFAPHRGGQRRVQRLPVRVFAGHRRRRRSAGPGV